MAVLELKLAERWLFSLNKWRKSGYFDEHKILKVAEKWLLLSKKWRILKFSFWQHWPADMIFWQISEDCIDLDLRKR